MNNISGGMPLHRATKPSLEKGDGRTGGIWLSATRGGRLVKVGRNLPIGLKCEVESPVLVKKPLLSSKIL